MHEWLIALPLYNLLLKMYLSTSSCLYITFVSIIIIFWLAEAYFDTLLFLLHNTSSKLNPHHANWNWLGVSISNVNLRFNRCTSVFKLAKLICSYKSLLNCSETFFFVKRNKVAYILVYCNETNFYFVFFFNTFDY